MSFPSGPLQTMAATTEGGAVSNPVSMRLFQVATIELEAQVEPTE
jgi:hypothetical protein